MTLIPSSVYMYNHTDLQQILLRSQNLTGTVCMAFFRRLRIALSRLIQFITTEPLAFSASLLTLPSSAMTSGTAHAYVSMLSISMLKSKSVFLDIELLDMCCNKHNEQHVTWAVFLTPGVQRDLCESSNWQLCLPSF